MATGPSAARSSVVEETLLQFHRSPGRFAIARREPAILFGSIHQVLQLALGRSATGYAPPRKEVQEAACFFVRTALLNPNADHYALLGLDRRVSAEALKERYRLMMRLMHPDFAAPTAAWTWPADTAARVNQAYEVLSSAVRRNEYDVTLPVTRPAPLVPTALSVAAMRAAAAQPPAEDPRRRLKSLAVVFGSVGVMLLGLILLGGPERDMIVQREGFIQRSAPEVSTAAPMEPLSFPLGDLFRIPLLSRTAAAPMAAASRASAPAPAALVREEPARATAAAAEPAPAAIAAAPPIQPPVLVATAPPVVPAPPAAAPVVEAALVAPPSAPPPPVARSIKSAPGITIAEVHPLLARLVQQVESGSGERLLTVLDRDSRDLPAVQALVSHYNSLVEGRGPVSVSHVQFRSEPIDGRLRVTGYLTMEVGATSASAATGKQLLLQAEFASRNGAIVMTSLARSSAPAPAKAQ